MKILVIDGQGGKIGRAIIELTLKKYPDTEITAVGTNSIASSTMLKGGAKFAATGENAVLVAVRKADVIIGPLGIIAADSLLGEITPKMAAAIGQSEAVKILIPMNKCDILIAGITDISISTLLDDATLKLGKIIGM